MCLCLAKEIKLHDHKMCLCIAKEIKNKKKIQKIHYNKFLILITLGTVSAEFTIVLRCA